jgi:dUTP pyrophosphatase
MSITINVLSKRELKRSHSYNAGVDLYSNEDVDLLPNMRYLCSTGLKLNIPPGYVGMIMSRSGISIEFGVVVLNAPGIIDSGYTGEIKVNLMNFGIKTLNIKKGYRIAQLLITRIEYPKFDYLSEELDNLDSDSKTS